jgi:NAD(P)H dehydrogenase (quinone)
MTTVSIIYFSGFGHTTKLAEAVARGAASAGAKAQLVPIRNEDIVQGRYQNAAVLSQLDKSDAIIFGSPTYMGGPAAQFKAFADATGERWYARGWANKIAGGFTVSGGPSGDKLQTLQYFCTLALQHSMVWVGLNELPRAEINRLSSYSGVMAQAGQEAPEVAPNQPDQLTGESLGRRVAEAASRWNHSLRGSAAATKETVLANV